MLKWLDIMAFDLTNFQQSWQHWYPVTKPLKTHGKVAKRRTFVRTPEHQYIFMKWLHFTNRQRILRLKSLEKQFDVNKRLSKYFIIKNNIHSHVFQFRNIDSLKSGQLCTLEIIQKSLYSPIQFLEEQLGLNWTGFWGIVGNAKMPVRHWTLRSWSPWNILPGHWDCRWKFVLLHLD